MVGQTIRTVNKVSLGRRRLSINREPMILIVSAPLRA
jgi:hypothetical protein